MQIHCAHGILSLTRFPAHGIILLNQCIMHWLNNIMPWAGKCVNDNMPSAQRIVTLPMF